MGNCQAALHQWKKARNSYVTSVDLTNLTTTVAAQELGSEIAIRCANFLCPSALVMSRAGQPIISGITASEVSESMVLVKHV